MASELRETIPTFNQAEPESGGEDWARAVTLGAPPNSRATKMMGILIMFIATLNIIRRSRLTHELTGRQ